MGKSKSREDVDIWDNVVTLLEIIGKSRVQPTTRWGYHGFSQHSTVRYEKWP